MITVTEAFRKFRSRLELNDREQRDASKRQQQIRDLMRKSLKSEDDFLTGSYRRHTKTKPLKDVDIFYVLHPDERKNYRDGKHPSLILKKTEEILAAEYGSANVKQQRRSVSVAFPVTGEEDQVVSFDVVPAFTKGDHYEIPDKDTASGWTETNPKIHAEKATEANEAYSGEWKGMVRMIKRWNREKEKPVKPSFLLEVMSLDLIQPEFGGEYPREFMMLFSSAADRIFDAWPDPAGLGPPVSDSMNESEKSAAQRALKEAAGQIRIALNHSANGRNGEALQVYRDLFGPLFPLS